MSVNAFKTAPVRQRKNKKGETIIQVLDNEVESTETDSQIIERLRQRFEILNDMTQMSIDGIVRGMVVTGPPGVGKSFGVEAVLKDAGIMKKLSNDSLRRFGVEKRCGDTNWTLPVAI